MTALLVSSAITTGLLALAWSRKSWLDLFVKAWLIGLTVWTVVVAARMP